MAIFYMKNARDDGHSYGNASISIEDVFDGLHYLSCKGLLNKGKPKNVYTEKYADSDKLRVWQGETIAREATSVEFEFAFVGSTRQATYEAFYEYVRYGQILYWDDVRKKEALLVLMEATEPSEDIYVGSTPYLCATFRFQNLYGECPDVESPDWITNN